MARKMIEGYTAEELELLTPVEREALEAESDTDPDKKVIRVAASEAEAKAVEDAEGIEKIDDEQPEPTGKQTKGYADQRSDTRMPTDLDGEDPPAAPLEGEDAEKAAAAEAAAAKAAEEAAAAEAAKTETAEEKLQREAAEKDAAIAAADAEPPPPERITYMEVPPDPKKDFKALKAELSKKYENGELTEADYGDQRDALVMEETAYVTGRDAALRFNQTASANLWSTVQEQFHQKNPGWGPENDIRYRALQGSLESVIEWCEAKWPGRVFSAAWVLEEAKRRVEAAFAPGGVAAAPAAKTAAEKAAEEKKAAEAKAAADKRPKAPVLPLKRKPPLESLAPTLAHLPAAGEEELGPTSADDKFAALDKLADDPDPLKFERALARLSEEDRNQYLKSA